jgi:hypothetical protein
MGGILQVDTIQNNNATTLITQTNSTTLTFGVTGQNIVIPSGVTFNTASATVTLPSTISATTINATTINATTLNSSTLNVTTVVLAAGAVGTPSLTTSGDTNTGIFFSTTDTIDFAEGGVATGQFDSSGNFKFNSGYGSVATAYGCRAWVNFNGTGVVAIREDGNVTSITDNGTGDYTINFTTAMPDVNYAVSGTTQFSTADNTGGVDLNIRRIANAILSSSVRVITYGSSSETSFDCLVVTTAVFR